MEIKTQVVGPAQIIEIKATGIIDVPAQTEYVDVNDEIPVDKVKQRSLIANVNEIYREEVLDKAIKTAVIVPEKPKSKLPLVAALAAGYFMFKG